MKKRFEAFLPADILIPREGLEYWSVIACDQFTAEPEYWRETERITAGKPTALALMLPEAFLEGADPAEKAREMAANMRGYLESGVFRTVENSYVFVERAMKDGRVRRGIVGRLDLESYDFSNDAVSLTRASEETVISRLAARVVLREGAELEMPHIMLLMDDVEGTVVKTAEAGAGEVLYDFPLMQGGGAVRGRRISGAAAERLTAAIEKLGSEAEVEKRYGKTGKAPVLFAVGDGNHSLAAAKLCWEKLKDELPESERACHPARYALVELVNIHEPALDFEPIHRILFETDAAAVLKELSAAFAGADGERKVVCVFGKEERELLIPASSAGEAIRAVQEKLDEIVASGRAKIDYIHGEASLRDLAAREGSLGLLMPVFGKSELFSSVIRSGVFPRKSFSMGHAEDKRYYLECRKIR